ncbi:allantoinase AllB [Paenibacillus sambharensis]|uniref:Allantoinase n=1 Tax=Paenibacillus sambharensis TaxID=1803190 RepID=A0A2W1LBI4_9BACL|nr:allantoinase AllB [Paenibacillus sambharensis]PZD96099.1 allantoinase AllB [Paenibacillus sambharensis]
MSLDLVIHGGSVVLPNRVMPLDIAIRDGRITALSSRGESEGWPAERRVDASGLHVFPGMIDVHVHFNEPNLGHWEGFAAGSAALAAGGCTTYIDMPLNGNPPTVTVKAFEAKLKLASGQSAVDYCLWGGLVPGNAGELEGMARAGAAGFKAFLSDPGGVGEGRFRQADDWTLYEGMKRIASFGGLLALHAENDTITSMLGEAAAAEGRTDASSFAASRPVAAETEAVGKALHFAALTGCRLHFVHISSPDAVRMITDAKAAGLDVTAETCPHYLLLTDEDMAAIGPAAKCAPPLRGREQIEQLWALLEEGQIDLIASDHSPCPTSMKEPASGSFLDAWGGISGAQSSLELMLDEGVKRRGLSCERISKLLSGNPARRFGLYPNKGEIMVGAEADLALVDMNRSYTLQAEHLKYRHKHSPYIGRTIGCRVAATYVRGVKVYDLACREAVAKDHGRPVLPRGIPL